VNPSDIVATVLALAREERYRRYYADTLVRLVEVDTTGGRPPEAAAASEAACLGSSRASSGATCRTRRSSRSSRSTQGSKSCEDYTAPPAPYSLAEYYRTVTTSWQRCRGRGARIPLIFNAHMDTVAPHIPPRVEDGACSAAGAADDKGSAALLLTSLMLLRDLGEVAHVRPRAPRMYQLVIEEERRGNGTLSALLDERARGFAALVLEITSLARTRRIAAPSGSRPTCGGRRPGADRRARRRGDRRSGSRGRADQAGERPPALPPAPRPDVSRDPRPLREAPSAGQRLRRAAGSRRAPQRSSGPSGRGSPGTRPRTATRRRSGTRRRASRSCGSIIGWRSGRRSGRRARGRARGAREGRAHGAIHRCDCALIKATAMIRALEEAGASVELACGERDEMLLEGGQGFVPTHAIGEIKERLSAAARRGAVAYARRIGSNDAARARSSRSGTTSCTTTRSPGGSTAALSRPCGARGRRRASLAGAPRLGRELRRAHLPPPRPRRRRLGPGRAAPGPQRGGIDLHRRSHGGAAAAGADHAGAGARC